MLCPGVPAQTSESSCRARLGFKQHTNMMGLPGCPEFQLGFRCKCLCHVVVPHVHQLTLLIKACIWYDNLERSSLFLGLLTLHLSWETLYWKKAFVVVIVITAIITINIMMIITLRQTAPSREMNRFCSCTRVSCICRMAAWLVTNWVARPG